MNSSVSIIVLAGNHDHVPRAERLILLLRTPPQTIYNSNDIDNYIPMLQLNNSTPRQKIIKLSDVHAAPFFPTSSTAALASLSNIP